MDFYSKNIRRLSTFLFVVYALYALTAFVASAGWWWWERGETVFTGSPVAHAIIRGLFCRGFLVAMTAAMLWLTNRAIRRDRSTSATVCTLLALLGAVLDFVTSLRGARSSVVSLAVDLALPILVFALSFGVILRARISRSDLLG